MPYRRRRQSRRTARYRKSTTRTRRRYGGRTRRRMRGATTARVTRQRTPIGNSGWANFKYQSMQKVNLTGVSSTILNPGIYGSGSNFGFIQIDNISGLQYGNIASTFNEPTAYDWCTATSLTTDLPVMHGWYHRMWQWYRIYKTKVTITFQPQFLESSAMNILLSPMIIWMVATSDPLMLKTASISSGYYSAENIKSYRFVKWRRLSYGQYNTSGKPTRLSMVVSHRRLVPQHIDLGVTNTYQTYSSANGTYSTCGYTGVSATAISPANPIWLVFGISTEDNTTLTSTTSTNAIFNLSIEHLTKFSEAYNNQLIQTTLT